MNTLALWIGWCFLVSAGVAAALWCCAAIVLRAARLNGRFLLHLGMFNWWLAKHRGESTEGYIKARIAYWRGALKELAKQLKKDGVCPICGKDQE